MNKDRQRRGWALIAVIAIVAAIALLLFPMVIPGTPGRGWRFLPILFVGIISPLSLLSPLACFYLGRMPDAPVPFRHPSNARLPSQSPNSQRHSSACA